MPINSSPTDRVDFFQDYPLSPNQFVINVTHSADADGHASAMIIKRFFRNPKIIATNHGKQLNYKDFPFNVPIIVTDFTLTVEDMRHFLSSNPIIWIDHHQTYMTEEYQEFAKLDGYRSTECSGCKLLWQYLYGTGAPVPRFVEYVSDYDTWQFKHPETLAFSYGLGLYNIQPGYCSEALSSKLFTDDEFIDSVINMGQRLQTFYEDRNKILCRWNGFKTNVFGEYPAVAMNIRNTNSKVLDSMLDPERRLIFTFGYDNQITKQRCSLYATEDSPVDCSQLMRTLGGGGHKGAAGCQCEMNEVPIEIKRTPEPPKEEDYIAQLNAMCEKEPLLYKAAHRDLWSLIRRCNWSSTFAGHPTMFVNNPLWDIDAIYQSGTIADYELVVFWNLSRSGWYRYRVYSLERNHKTPEQLLEMLKPDLENLGMKNAEVKGQAVWMYSENAPIPVADANNQKRATQTYGYYKGRYVENPNLK